MTELPSGKDQEDLLQEFQYARDLFVQLFQDDIPLVNLGYTGEQKVRARRALTPLQEEVRVYLKPNPWASYGNDDTGGQLNLLRLGGYKLWAQDRLPDTTLFQAQDNEIIMARLTLFEGKPPSAVAIINMLPEDVDYTNIDGLVHHLYEGSSEGYIITSLERQNFLTGIKSIAFPTVASFRAMWVDQETKLDLVVETDLPDREWGELHPKKYVETWRRLPVIEHGGKSWLPFGRKPNVSKEATQKALESRRGIVGKFVFGDKPQ